MIVTQEFVVIPIEGGVRIHGVPDFPSGTPVGPHGQKLHVEGPVWVRQPDTELTQAQWETVAGPAQGRRMVRHGRAVLDREAFEELEPEDLCGWRRSGMSYSVQLDEGGQAEDRRSGGFRRKG